MIENIQKPKKAKVKKNFREVKKIGVNCFKKQTNKQKQNKQNKKQKLSKIAKN